MTASLSLSEYADKGFAVLPFEPRGGDAPSVCISLLGSGDMYGDGAAARNRRALFEALAIEERRVRSVTQVHSLRVLEAGGSGHQDGSAGSGKEEADGLITDDRELVLSVRVADCYPIALFDRGSGAFGIVHSGWRGTGIAVEAVHRMARLYGSKAGNISALLGPGIRSCCYDVPPERAGLFRSRFGAEAVVGRGDRVFLDLPAANRRILEAAGVSDIVEIDDCTSCTPFLGSFRRQGPNDFSHMLALIGYFG